MILLINKDNIFNEEQIKDLQMEEYENYEERICYVEKETLKYFEMLKAHLAIENIFIDIDDGYRSLETQENIFLESMKKHGLDYTEKIVAMPGYSEHHTGQALDIVIRKDNIWVVNNDELLLEKDTFKKIHNVLKYFGFIIRYPKGKEKITGYSYEPWHIRYIGKEDAMKIGNLSLEEYLNRL